MEEEILQKIYKLTTELTSQQQNNQDLALSLSNQLSDLKHKAESKIPNEDVEPVEPLLPEKRDEQMEQLKTKLEDSIASQKAIMETNMTLEKEIMNLQALVKDYETSFETVTSKLRWHANTVTEGQMRMKREYEALLDAEKGTTAALFIENTILQTQLRHLSKSLRQVYENESVNESQDQEIAQLRKENQLLLEMLQVARLPDQATSAEQSSPILQASPSHASK
ncbi:hypothetical protein A0J61_04593 [Choanephora cucurbitarum]|uniref:Uncharacterized protein n=1 Tax=Choanephora cucurbitarum TaxID=101091 RepID=A0A1C7NE34_9FUNG|nr:hypothetical protein A0J61_04593 [Choanephora cucurbitarum]